MDPLRDCGTLFALKLKKSGASSVHLKYFKNAPHGLLNMNAPIFELNKEAEFMI